MSEAQIFLNGLLLQFYFDNNVYHAYKLTMNSKEIIARLQKEGFQHTATKGDHWKFKKGSRIVVVPHPKKDFPMGTLRNIFRQAGWDWR